MTTTLGKCACTGELVYSLALHMDGLASKANKPINMKLSVTCRCIVCGKQLPTSRIKNKGITAASLLKIAAKQFKEKSDG